MPARNSGAKAGRCVARQRQKQHHCRWGPTVQTRLSMAPIKQYLEHASFCKNIQGWQANKTVWPSGLRRWLKAPFRKGVGSNPTAVNAASCCSATADGHWQGGPTFSSPCSSAEAASVFAGREAKDQRRKSRIRKKVPKNKWTYKHEMLCA